MKLKKILAYFSLFEKLLWSLSVVAIIVAFCVFDRVNYLTLITSLIGVTSLIFNAKGNPIGHSVRCTELYRIRSGITAK